MFLSLIREAYVSISTNRLRTFLAMLGIVIGVSSVVALVAIGAGSSKQVEEAISKLGTNMLIVTPGATESKGIRSTSYSELSVGDVRAIAQMYGVSAVAPSTSRQTLLVAASGRNWNTSIYGTTSEYFAVHDWDLKFGSLFGVGDNRRASRVAIIGSTVARELFGDEDPVDRKFRIGDLTFKVVGLLESKGQTLSGQDKDDVVFIPFTTMQRKVAGAFFPDSVSVIYTKVAQKEWLNWVARDITKMLRERHKVRAAEEDPFSIRSLSALTATTSQTTKALSYLLGAIASISLVVGGIGIMNIMLVTVAERTREIGIRKAIGATNSHVLWQFLLESILISTAGSILGLVLGVAVAIAAERMMGMVVAMTLWSVIIAISVSIIVGMFSGLYPAYRASRLQPIDALRQTGG